MEIKYTIDETTLRECMARGYCTKENKEKELDANLIDAMVEEIKNSYTTQICPSCEKTTSQTKVSESWHCEECGDEYETVFKSKEE